MTDDQIELRRIHWSEVFSFAHIFKSFRMAIHPSKLALALAAVVLLFVGGHLLGWVWGVAGQKAYPNEIYQHYLVSARVFDERKEQGKKQQVNAAANLWINSISEARNLRSYQDTLSQLTGGGLVDDAFKTLLDERNKGKDPLNLPERKKVVDETRDDLGKAVSEAKSNFADEMEAVHDILDGVEEKAEKNLKDRLKAMTDEEDKKDLKKDFREDLAKTRLAVTRRRMAFQQQLLPIEGQNIFAAFSSYEWDCMRNALKAVRYGNIFTGLSVYQDRMAAKGYPTASVEPAPQPAYPVPADHQAPGFFVYILRGAHGVCWLISEHAVFGVVYLVLVLGTVALFGGAVYRISALHFAREEKISAIQALKFSLSKFLNFLTAPLIPLAVIFAVGLLLMLGGLLLGTWAGGVLLGILLPLGLLLGLFIAFMAIGLIAGGPLMYPTIAVEGSDSFDAISRSFSYVFARPWRSALYGLVALVYGVITYLFVRLFIFLTLCATHWFVAGGVFTGGDRLGEGADKLDVIWAAPQFGDLFGRFNWQAMSGMESVGAVLIGVWVFLMAGVVAAYLLSYFASATTTIYFLLRREVDATDLDDVYVEEADEEDFAAPQAAPEPKEEEKAEEKEGGDEPTAATEEPKTMPEPEATGPAGEEDTGEDKDDK